jgi:hypothetical protein
MARYVIPFLLMAAIFTGCANEPNGEEARRPDEAERTKRIAETTTERPENPETTAETAGGEPEYITIGESETVEGGVRTAQVIVTAKKTSEPALRRIVEDLKAEYRNFDAVNVEIMDGPAGFGRAGTATIVNTDEGARASGLPEGAPNEDGYVLEIVN